MKTGIVGFGMLILGLMVGSALQASTANGRFDLSLQLLSTEAQAVVNPDSISVAPKLPSPSRATKLSLIATALPVAAGIVLHKDESEGSSNDIAGVLVISGVIIGPSVGYFYGGCAGRGGVGIAIRTGVVIGTVVALAAVVDAHEGDEFLDFSGLAAALTVVGIGGALILIDAIYDIVRVDGTVRHHNARQADFNLTVAPQVVGPGKVPGLQLSLRF